MRDRQGTGINTQRRVPAGAAWLGGAGALPFVMFAFLPLAGLSLPGLDPVTTLVAYGAVILSFMGGIQWGWAMTQAEAADSLFRPLTISILPALVGWVAVLLPGTAALVALSTAFAFVLAVDIAAAAAGHTPAWYPRLRWPLTVVVIASLLAAIPIRSPAGLSG